jgi:hypothetical protein
VSSRDSGACCAYTSIGRCLGPRPARLAVVMSTEVFPGATQPPPQASQGLRYILSESLAGRNAITRWLVALRSMVEMTRQIGRAAWTTDVEGPGPNPTVTRPAQHGPAGAGDWLRRTRPPVRA